MGHHGKRLPFIIIMAFIFTTNYNGNPFHTIVRTAQTAHLSGNNVSKDRWVGNFE
jgi:hypothetical protein